MKRGGLSWVLTDDSMLVESFPPLLNLLFVVGLIASSYFSAYPRSGFTRLIFLVAGVDALSVVCFRKWVPLSCLIEAVLLAGWGAMRHWGATAGAKTGYGLCLGGVMRELLMKERGAYVRHRFFFCWAVGLLVSSMCLL